MKRLYRSTKNRVVTGLLAGIAEYMNIDPAILRVLFIFVLFVTHIIPGIIAYLIASIIVPSNPSEHGHSHSHSHDHSHGHSHAENMKTEPSTSEPKTSDEENNNEPSRNA